MTSRNLILSVEPKTQPKLESFFFQEKALEKIKDLEYAAIFHEQGLGKTKIAIDLFLYWLDMKVVDSVLLVTKKGLISNWLKELRVHSHITPKVLTQNSRDNYLALNSPSRLYLAHYEAVHGEAERMRLFLRTRPVAVILDESHKIKNPDAKITLTFFSLSQMFHRRAILSGTPIANRPFDLWSQIFFLDGGAHLGTSFAQFKVAFDLPKKTMFRTDELASYEGQMADLFPRISEFAVRETKDSSGITLPEKIYIDKTAEWEPHQIRMYEAYKNELVLEIARDNALEEDSAEDLLKRILRLVQVASNPILVDERYTQESAKTTVLKSLLREICSNQEKAIVWTTFTKNVDYLCRLFKEYGSTKVHGKLDSISRERNLSKFLTDPECRVLFATPGSAKEGLTLTVANHAIFYDRSFSLDDYLQAQDRIHRISQEKVCYVYNLHLRNSVDDWLDSILKAKAWTAKLAQGDISIDEYRQNIEYDFVWIVKEILGLNER